MKPSDRFEGWLVDNKDTVERFKELFEDNWVDGQIDAMKYWVEFNPQKGNKKNWKTFMSKWLKSGWEQIPERNRPKKEGQINYNRPPGV